MSSIKSNENLDILINILNGKTKDSKTYITMLENSILSILYYKINYYQNEYIKKSKYIIKYDQPRAIKKLCNLGQVKPVIEYNKDNNFYSMSIPNRTQINLLSDEEKSYTEDEYQNLISTLDNPEYFELSTQCKKSPASGSIFSYTSRISEEPDIAVDNYPVLDSSSYTKEDLNTYAKQNNIDISKVTNPKKQIAEEIYEYYRQLGKSRLDTNVLVNVWFNKTYHEEKTFKREGKEKKHDKKGPVAVEPDFSDLQKEISFFQTALVERDELKNLVNSLIKQFKKLLNTPLEKLVSLSNKEAILDINSLNKNSTGLNQRRQELIISLQKLKETVTGDSRKNIRDNIVKMVNSFIKNWKINVDSYLNIALLGGPGTGKTTIAERIGSILGSLGILARSSSDISIYSRSNMVGQYVGETAKKVRDILIGNLENVMFIDEAYALAQATAGNGLSNSHSYDPYGVEAINEIVGFLDKYKGKICLIVAGYPCEMQKYWFDVNPGLIRRTPYVWILKEFTADELFTIIKLNVDNWKTNNAKILLPNDINKIRSNDPFLLEDPNTGQHLFNIISVFRPFLVNEAGDAELLADKLVQAYIDKGSSLTMSDVNEVIYQFMEPRIGSTTKKNEKCQEVKVTIPDINFNNLLEKIQHIK